MKAALLKHLASEVRNDVARIDVTAAALAPWATRLAEGEDVFIPASFLHHLYTGIESASRRVMLIIDGEAPEGGRSHARLLDLAMLEIRGVRPPILPSSQGSALHDLLDFRHMYRHAYGRSLEPERVLALSQKAVAIWPEVRAGLLGMAQFAEDAASSA